MKDQAIQDLIFKMADDSLIIGHRNSEWTGIGPMLEEDMAFSSMAQDKVGHAQALYAILHEKFNLPTADQLAFSRKENERKCCHLVELPIGEYDFSLVRHFFFDHAEALRYKMLESSSYAPLAILAKKFSGEIKYHTMHADTFLHQLAIGNEESKTRMQLAINYAFPFALGIFEKSEFEAVLIEENIFEGEDSLKSKWLILVTDLVEKCGLKLPASTTTETGLGGRAGKHSSYLLPLLNEMTEVFQIDPAAEW